MTLDTTQRTPSDKPSKTKFTPAHGRDFAIAVRVVDEYETSRTRDRIAYIVLGCGALSMAVAAGYGFYSEDFGAIKNIWTVAGPIIGIVIGYYFHRGGKASE
jgi:hypothetical protein